MRWSGRLTWMGMERSNIDDINCKKCLATTKRKTYYDKLFRKVFVAVLYLNSHQINDFISDRKLLCRFASQNSRPWWATRQRPNFQTPHCRPPLISGAPDLGQKSPSLVSHPYSYPSTCKAKYYKSKRDVYNSEKTFKWIYAVKERGHSSSKVESFNREIRERDWAGIYEATFGSHKILKYENISFVSSKNISFSKSCIHT